MRETSTKRKPLLFAYLGAVAVVLLLSASLVVPTLSAYAAHDNSNGKSEHGKKHHQKDRKGKDPKQPERCENFVPEKYNKHCE